MSEYDFVSTISVHPLKRSYIEKEIDCLIGKYLTSNDEALDKPIDLETLLLSIYEYDFIIENIRELYPALRTFNGDILGCTDFEKKLVIVDSELYENNPNRANYTIAHEITHILLHEKYYFRHKNQLSLDLFNIQVPSFACRDYSDKKIKKPEIEKQADMGASLLLMPKDLMVNTFNKIKNDYNYWLSKELKPENETYLITDLAKNFSSIISVSKEALRYRLEALGLQTFGFRKENTSGQLSLLNLL